MAVDSIQQAADDASNEKYTSGTHEAARTAIKRISSQLRELDSKAPPLEDKEKFRQFLQNLERPKLNYIVLAKSDTMSIDELIRLLSK